MDTRITVGLILIISSQLFQCVANKKQSNIHDAHTVSLEITLATENSYFPGTGIGHGRRYHIQLVNHSTQIIYLDSIQTAWHCIPFDGNKTEIQTKDTLDAFAYGLTIDTGVFPNLPTQPEKGNKALNDGGIIYYHTTLKSDVLMISKFSKTASEFFE